MFSQELRNKKLWSLMGAIVLCITLILVPCGFGTADFGDPIRIQPYYDLPYLTWQGDPSTSVTVNYHTAEKPEEIAVLYYEQGAEQSEALRAEGQGVQIPDLADQRFINSVQLTDLKPGQAYSFTLASVGDGTAVYHFQTLSDGDEPLRFAITGDTLASGIFERLLKHVSAQSPRFIVVGGDLAYANGDVNQVGRWNRWLKLWHQYGTTPDGMLIPLVLAIGNHEYSKSTGTLEERAPFYYHFFPQGGETFFSRRFGANFGMIVLDSNHIVPHEDQKDWLEAQLQNFDSLPFTAAVYHVPLYPSHRDFEGSASEAGRTHWLPLFDKHTLSVGFEHHDHDFKRSKRLRGNELDPQGTLYLGDGSGGVVPRSPRKERWYLEKTGNQSHFWIVDVTADQMNCSAMDIHGAIFDETSLEARQSGTK